MKRFQLYTALVLVVLLTLLLVYWHQSHNATNAVSTNIVADVQVTTNSEISASSNISTKNKPSEAGKPPVDPLAQMGITPGMTESQKQQKWAEWYVKEAAKLVPEQKPFEFYGKVVDENTQAVAGAGVHFILSTTTSPNGVLDADTASADDGGFSLTGKTGSSVSVYVSKTGYNEVKSINRINYDPTGNNSSKDSPVYFHLRKKGTGVDLISAVLNLKMPRDGTPVNIDLINKKIGADGQLQISQVKPLYENWKTATAWSFSMTLQNGGFVEQSEEFPFEAPINGYLSTVAFDFKAGNPDWKTNVKKSYYIVFGTPPSYGRIVIENDIMWGGPHISYSFNPDGSRNLEPQ